MKRNKINYWINLLMLLAFLVTSISGIIIWLRIEYFYCQNIIGLTKFQLREIHLWGSLLLLILVSLHLLIHWDWMVRMTKNMIFKKK